MRPDGQNSETKRIAGRFIKKNSLDLPSCDPYSNNMISTSLLIVDDELEMRVVLSDTLKVLGMKIYLAKDGAEAIEIVKKHKISAVLSDVNMPNMKGVELLKRIRNEGYVTPFVIMTAYGDKKMALEALRLGAFDFIDKPWSNEQLFAVVQKVLEIGDEILFWENEADVQKSVLDYQAENSQRLIAALAREQGYDFKKKL